MTFFDDLGNELNFDKTPKKIVSLVPSITETLYDLNLEDNIVGITKFCVHPVHFKHTKTIVGGTKDAKIDKIKELQPDIVFCNKEENTPEIVKQLQEFTQVYVTVVNNIEDAVRMIQKMGLMLNRRVDAQLISNKINLKLEDFNWFIKDFEVKKSAYFIWYNPWMAAGDNTFINSLLTLNKFDNIYKNKKESYPTIEAKRIRLEGDPDFVFFSSEPFPFKDKHVFEMGRFTHHASAVYVDGEMFSWFGSRLLKSFDYFKSLRERITLSTFK
ncbi:helical backbone metal receptor [Wenyingzhuangia sp. chi5]|uniref:Helical backbone metal receptor n=1 Tax=Wenyingzhuangia gilva TaxID=3057677 RepID=A0ABT8VNI1_9FLAO|nr:helical backbone metal receptor [Wenyingzhuangia sp. chi5]MDO3693529.1 helical backbone metal receptor [Wenyingzhuangia sp. chi5]